MGTQARRDAEAEAATCGKLRMELSAYSEELRVADAREGALATAQADRDGAMAEASSLRRELAILRNRIARGGETSTTSHIRETVHLRL